MLLSIFYAPNVHLTAQNANVIKLCIITTKLK